MEQWTRGFFYHLSLLKRYGNVDARQVVIASFIDRFSGSSGKASNNIFDGNLITSSSNEVMCSVCNREGHLQVRGSSARIGHYVGCDGRTRIVEWHRIDGNQFKTVNNGNQLLVIKSPI